MHCGARMSSSAASELNSFRDYLDNRIADGETVFSLVIKAKENVKLSKVFSVSSRYTVAEAYKQNGELMEVKLAFNGQAVSDNFELFQNTPNPFNHTTVISFNLPEAASATLTITDVSGKVVKVVTDEFAKGYNEVKFSRNELNGTGILYYQLDTPTDSGVKMM